MIAVVTVANAFNPFVLNVAVLYLSRHVECNTNVLAASHAIVVLCGTTDQRGIQGFTV